MGLAAAQAFAEAGASVVMADFRENVLQAEAAKLRGPSRNVIALRCDVSDDAQVEALVERAVSEFGRLDAAFNNAGTMSKVVPTAESTKSGTESSVSTCVACGVA